MTWTEPSFVAMLNYKELYIIIHSLSICCIQIKKNVSKIFKNYIDISTQDMLQICLMDLIQEIGY